MYQTIKRAHKIFVAKTEKGMQIKIIRRKQEQIHGTRWAMRSRNIYTSSTVLTALEDGAFMVSLCRRKQTYLVLHVKCAILLPSF
jgi:phosphopantothenate synthetase